MALIMSQSKKIQTPEKAPVVAEIRKRCVLTERDIDRRDKVILDFHVFAPEGTLIDDLLSPDCWAHIAYKLQPLSQITVTEKSGKWVALLHVISCTRLAALTQVISYTEIGANANLKSSEEFEVVWINHQDKFGVMRKSDKAWIQKNIPTASDAAVVLGNEMKAMRGR